MKTKLIRLMVALSMLPAVVQAQDAYSTNADGSIYTYSTNADGSANIVAYAGPPWVVTIPTHINGLTVTTIGESAFQDTSLTSVTIPNSVTSIGTNAFYFCLSLTNATLGNSVTSIEANEFYQCSSLTSVTMPNSVTNIGAGVFEECTSLTNAIIGNSVTSIGEDAFAHCISLTSVTIPNSVTSIGEGAFSACALKSVTIPNSVTSIGDYAFQETALSNVAIPNSVTNIGGSAFFQCTSLKSATIGNSVTSIGDSVFGNCASLTSVTIGNSITNVGFYAFADCTSLTTVTIGNSVTSIGGEAFAFCSRLTSVTIPDSVTSIGEFAFEYCSGLTSVTIPDGVTSIGLEAFYGCSSLTGAYFPGNAPSPTNDSTVFSGDPATVYYLPGTTGWGAMFDGLPTALWFLPNPLILNHSAGFGVQPGGFGFTISWATNASVVVQAATNLVNPVWIPLSTSPLTGGSSYFSDPQWTNYPSRFYRAASAFTVGGTLTGLPAGDTVTLQDNGGDDLTLSTNGTFTFPTALPNGHAYSVTVSALMNLDPLTTCTVTNGSGTISGANVTNVAVQCMTTPLYTGNLDVDMYNAAVADGTANGGVPGVMLTEDGGPFRVTAEGPISVDVARIYATQCVFTHVLGTSSCSSTTFPSGTPVIQFGTLLQCGFGPYKY